MSSTAGTYWFARDKEVNSVNKNMFRNYDLKAIDEILLQSATGKISLKYSGAKWKVNEQHYANPDMIEVLFATLQQAEPKRPLAASLRDSVAKDLEATGVKVSLIAREKLQDVFYAGGNSTKTQAFFMDAQENKPYLVSIPGYRVYVSGIFELEESGWRDKFVFGFNWRNFQSLEVSFPDKPSDNFSVSMQNNYFTVQGLSKVDTTRLNDYLDDVSLLTVDEFIKTTSSLDSLTTVPALLNISVKDIGRKEYKLRIYPPFGKEGKYPGLINSSQWALFEKARISGLIRARHFFGN